MSTQTRAHEEPRSKRARLNERARRESVELATYIARIENITAGESREYWLARLEAAGVPCGPSNDCADAISGIVRLA